MQVLIFLLRGSFGNKSSDGDLESTCKSGNVFNLVFPVFSYLPWL